MCVVLALLFIKLSDESRLVRCNGNANIIAAVIGCEYIGNTRTERCTRKGLCRTSHLCGVVGYVVIASVLYVRSKGKILVEIIKTYRKLTHNGCVGIAVNSNFNVGFLENIKRMCSNILFLLTHFRSRFRSDFLFLFVSGSCLRLTCRIKTSAVGYVWHKASFEDRVKPLIVKGNHNDCLRALFNRKA